MDRIGDFGQVGTANLWISTPIFSTGTNEAEPRKRGAPVEPAVPGEAIEMSFAGEKRERTGRGFWTQVIHSICIIQVTAVHRIQAVHPNLPMRHEG
jgi:hypothetical protein